MTVWSSTQPTTNSSAVATTTTAIQSPPTCAACLIKELIATIQDCVDKWHWIEEFTNFKEYEPPPGVPLTLKGKSELEPETREDALEMKWELRRICLQFATSAELQDFGEDEVDEVPRYILERITCDWPTQSCSDGQSHQEDTWEETGKPVYDLLDIYGEEC